MASLTSVTLSHLLLGLPRGVAGTLKPLLRTRFGVRWAEVPFFTAALMMRGTLATSSPLKHAVIDLPCPGWPPRGWAPCWPWGSNTTTTTTATTTAPGCRSCC